jgi:alginate O-acetyltransferase complex protein AlgI
MENYWKFGVSDLFTYDAMSPLLFNSAQFMVLFAVFVSVYTILYKTYWSRALYVIAFSLFFYYKSSGVYVFMLVGSIGFNFYIAQLFHSLNKQGLRKILLVISVIANLGMLGYYKYTNFFLENISYISGNEFKPLDIFLPIGISFFTFQAMSYVIDVYRRNFLPEYNILDFAFYISFFPQLVAGPIVRASHFLPQLKKKITITREQISEGMFLIMQGLVKKAVIADYIAQYNDMVFKMPQTYSGFENLMAVYGYTLQIYCDFSGYSDIAIGIGKMMGFDLGVNFLKPYQARNITDFWRRWHISLSTWLRDYLYIPLGGNQKGKLRTYVNLFVTMLLGGLWHGASWKFVVWGGFHGTGLAVHKLYAKYIKPVLPSTWIGKFLSWLLTFHFVIFLWIFFRAPSFEKAIEMIRLIGTKFDMAYLLPFWNTRKSFLIMMLVGFAIHAIPVKTFDNLTVRFVRLPFFVKVIAFIVLVQLIIQFKSAGVQPFIYFQF